MIPGPTPVTTSIQNEMGRETAAFGDPDFVNDYKSVLEDLNTLWDCTGEIFVIAGSGTLAMEMAIANSLKKGDRVLIVSHGFFGDRFIEIVERKGIEYDVLSSEWGQVVPPEKIGQQLSEKDYQAVTVTHVDTSTGVAAPIEAIGNILKKFENTLFIVDGVCATAAEPEYVNKMGIDLLITGSQKAFGVPPGLAILWASENAMERRKALGTIPEYYADFYQWLPIMHDPSKYFATPAVNLVWALKESISIIQEEGLENRYSRHRETAKYIQSEMEKLGFKILAHPEHRAVTLSNLIYPEGIEDSVFRKTLLEEGVIVACGLGPYAGKLFRLGHMGNIDDHIIEATIAAIKRTLKKLGKKITPESLFQGESERY